MKPRLFALLLLASIQLLTACASPPATEAPPEPPVFLSQVADAEVAAGCVLVPVVAPRVQCSSGFFVAGLDQQSDGRFVFVSQILCCPLSG